MKVKEKNNKYTVTKNACKLCTPLGASFVFRGIENAMPLIHGSQGCATYIRRYIISHFNEPIDIASSNFSEDTAIFGGTENLKLAIGNIQFQYKPSLIGIPTTCLSETIGDDINLTLRELLAEHEEKDLPVLVPVSTPSYMGTHMDGFHSAVKAVVSELAKGGEKNDSINIFPSMISPADMRHLKEIFLDFNVKPLMLPDYSETFDGESWEQYQKIPQGGITLDEIQNMGSAAASIQFGRILSEEDNAGTLLLNKWDVPCYNTGLPIGINETDKFFSSLEYITGQKTPLKYTKERGRLIDSYIDGHKYISEKRAVIYGEEDLVVGLASFLSEIGIVPCLCASGGKSTHLAKKISEVVTNFNDLDIVVREGADFVDIENEIKNLNPDFLIGNSKGYATARRNKLPLIRVGFPIHDRIGGQRILHIGYRGAQELFDKITNTLMTQKQESSPVGYSYM